MRPSSIARLTGRQIGWLVAAICVSIAVLTGFGVRAVREWQHTEEQLADRRARETVDRLVTALTRDMRGVQTGILAAGWEAVPLDPPHDARTLVGSAFARYPYPESFFAWRGTPADTAVLFFNRWDRRPSWMPDAVTRDRFPVSVGSAPAVAHHLIARIGRDVRQGRQYSTFEITLGTERYQVVARLFYRDGFAEEIDRVVGFTVSLGWARQRYFPELARQVARIGDGLPVTIVDDHGRLVAGIAASGPTAATVSRPFPVMFFDPLLAGADSPADLSRVAWSVRVDPSAAGGRGAAAQAARGAIFVAAIAVVTLAVGLVLTARAARDSARLAGMRSEFVSTVTHELKTPIATIRAIGDTLVRGRVTDPQSLREYAQLVVQEAKRLTRLVENLLAYARITDVTEVYAFDALELRDVVDDALKGFRPQLVEAGFEVQVDVPPGVPAIRGDRTALGLVLDNLLDNAIRYSGASRWLGIRASRLSGSRVALEVSDHGVGIPASEIGQVTRRFYRGGRRQPGGSGLGLAIVQRIAGDHGGELVIESTAGSGTTVRVIIPAAEASDEQADPGR